MNAIDPAHYRGATLQVRSIIIAYKLGPDLANVLKYVCRYDKKNGAEDLRKASRYLRMFAQSHEAMAIQLRLWTMSPIGLRGITAIDVARDFAGKNAPKEDLIAAVLFLYLNGYMSLGQKCEALATHIDALA